MVKFFKIEDLMRLEELQKIIRSEVGVLFYFYGENCNVCHALKPKFKKLFDDKFPKIKQVYLDAHENVQIATNYQIFSVPTILVFLDGKEFIREGRTVSMVQIEEKLTRFYAIMTE